MVYKNSEMCRDEKSLGTTGLKRYRTTRRDISSQYADRFVRRNGRSPSSAHF